MGLGGGAVDPAGLSPVLVTGAGGFVGTWVRRRLEADGLAHMALTRADGDLAAEGVAAGLIATHAPATVLHLAGQAVPGDPVATWEANVRASWLLLDACRRAGVARVVVASSPAAAGPGHPQPLREDVALRPVGPYGASKAAVEHLARAEAGLGLGVAVVRLANVYGGGDRHATRLVPECVAAVLADRPPSLRSHGHDEHDFLYVEDAVDALLDVAGALGPGGSIVPGEVLQAASGIPWSAIRVAGIVARLGREDPVVEVTGFAPDEPRRTWMDPSRLRERTGWRARTDLEEGLRRTLEWERARR